MSTKHENTKHENTHHEDTPHEDTHTVHNAVKLVGEAFVPGASLLLDGKILPGAAHLLVGVVAGMALGPIGWGLVIANSYASSVTGKNLLKQFTKPHTEKKVEVHTVSVPTS